ncbi:MAG: SusC/RagA family TonB-linked outer membrane protein [Prevotella sp.]|jgi:TonB-linked SusC/RagA family outer membrane protein|nr:SusC/RagA family TonB-linked outer membrane protein [Prevotella sp.]
MSNKTNKAIRLAALTLFFVFSGTFYGFAQQHIQGKVLDDKTGEALIGVSVTVQGTTTGTVTDVDGIFWLPADKEATLQFSYLGYHNQSLKVGDNRNLTVRMQEDSQELDDVVVVGYGVQKKASSVGSIVQTRGEELLKVGNLNSLSEALQGKLNGVITINNNAKPGANTADIYIRGKASFGDNSPLVLVDGMERNMNDVDMNEIESISVLKDASATAVYGVKGANGVILVTTRRGEAKAPRVSFSANLGIKQFTTNVDFADYLTSMQYYNQAVANEGDWSKQIPQSTMDAWRNAYATGNYGPYNDVFPQIDWFDELVRDFGFSENYNLNVSGGDNFVSYFVSVGYQHDGDNYKIEKQDDFDPRYWFTRYNWRSNLDFNVTKTTRFSVKIAGKVGYQNEPVIAGTAGTTELFTPILTAPTNTFPIRYSDGVWGEAAVQGYNILANVSTRGQELNKTFQGWYDAELEQQLDFITKGLSAKAKVQYNSYSTTNTRYRQGALYNDEAFASQTQADTREHREYDYTNPTVHPDGSITYPLLKEPTWFPNSDHVGDYPTGVTYDSFGDYGRKLYYELSMDYKRSFGGHNVTALALFSRKITDSTDGSNFNYPVYYQDYVGRITYNYKERYLSELNMCYNGSEKFAPGKRYGFFPSLSLGWRISEEPLVQKLVGGTLSNLKVRYSLGQTGSDSNAGRFTYLQLFDSSGSVNYGYLQNIAHSPLYNEGTPANPDATWETATVQNLGIEIGLWHKLTLNADLFDEHRTGMLMTRRTMASWYGASSLPSVNMGETKNHGIEFELSWRDKINRDFNYHIGLNIAASENRIVFKDDPYDMAAHLKDAGKPIDYQSRYIAVGNYGSIDDVFNYAQTGISGITAGQMLPGDLVYIDYNGDGVIDSNDNVVAEELNYPLTTFSLNLGCKYKGFGLSLLFYSPRGINKNIPDAYLWDFNLENVKAQPNAGESWTPETANSTGVMRPVIRTLITHNNVGSTYKYRDYSYIRLKNVELNYTVPKKLLKKFGIDNITVYANGNNLITWSNLDKRIDPETGGAGSYPIVRTITSGIRMSF